MMEEEKGGFKAASRALALSSDNSDEAPLPSVARVLPPPPLAHQPKQTGNPQLPGKDAL